MKDIDVRPPSAIRSVALAVLVALLTGCSLFRAPQESPSPEVNAPTLPAEVFGTVPDRGLDITTTPYGFATDGSTTVAVGDYQGRVKVPYFKRSTDGGATWAEGKLSDDAARATGVEESSIGKVAVSNGLWVALGSKDDRIVTWSSRDAATWDRSEATGIDTSANLHHLVSLPDGFLLVGSVSAADGTHRVPTTWRSSDGVAWAATSLPGYGWLYSAAVRGDTVVAVGGSALDEFRSDGRQTFPLTFVSGDRGVSWQVKPTPEPADSGRFVTELVEIESIGDSFVASGSYFDGKRNTYWGYLLSSPDGSTWSLMPQLPRRERSTSLQGVLPLGGSLVVIMKVNAAEQSGLDAYRLQGGGWRPVTLPGLPEEPGVSAAVTMGDTALVAISCGTTSAAGTVLRTADAGATWTSAPIPPAPGMKPLVRPMWLTSLGGQVDAWGSAHGGFGTWRREGSTFSAPRMVMEEPRQPVSGITGTDAGIAMWGSLRGAGWLRLSRDGRDWSLVAPSTFNKVAQYHYSSINQVIWDRDRWVVVGDKSTNGGVRTSALVYTSPDGKTWTEGKPTRVYARGDAYGDEDELTDLAGLQNRTRTMRSVVGTGQGLVAVGSSSTTKGTQPRVWVSQDRQTWDIADLPTTGVAEARANSVIMVGSRLVARGSARLDGTTTWLPCLWSSTDSQQWSFMVMNDWGETSFGSVTAHGDEAVAVVASEDHTKVTLWRSPDGVQWTSAEVAVPNAAGGVEVTVYSSLIVDNQLLLVRVANRLDAVSTVVSVPL